MNLRNKIKGSFKHLSILAVALVLISWGYNGHYKINHQSSLSFTPEMEQFMNWAITLAQHASDADYRKETDPEESPRHYIDIDNYPGFAESGRIPQVYDSAVALYGQPFVIAQGILPWATKRSYDSLVSCFIRFDWEKAVLIAADLGHYVADAHNPLHITRNYNGQFSGNYGIHSRYETSMINAYLGEIEYSGDEISFISDVNGYIFSYIYTNYTFVDSVLAADDYAQGVAGNTTSSVYKAALWEKTRNFTIPLFKRASHSLAELIYSAWTEAGKPDMNSGPGIFDPKGHNNDLQLDIYPNPVTEYAAVRFNLPESTFVRIQVINICGVVMDTIGNKYLPAGQQELSLNLSDLPAGIYLISLQTGKIFSGKKILKTTP